MNICLSIQCLNRECYNCTNLQEFDCVLIDSCEYHSTRRNRDRLHDDTALCTRDNSFCIINSIVVISHPGQEDFCGMFVTELDVNLIFAEARHIARVRPEGNLPHFIRICRVRCAAVQHEVLCHHTYVSSLPTNIEID